jgi:hypothetical protein
MPRDLKVISQIGETDIGRVASCESACELSHSDLIILPTQQRI